MINEVLIRTTIDSIVLLKYLIKQIFKFDSTITNKITLLKSNLRLD